MFNIGLTVFTILAVLWISQADVPPAGKCHMNPTPMPVDFNGLTQTYKFWQLIYVSDDDAFVNMVSEFREITANSHNWIATVGESNMKDNSVSSYSFTLTYGSDLLIYEDAVDGTGKKFNFRWTPLAVTNGGAMLYYRCSDNGTLNTDTRHVTNPTGNPFNATDSQYLQDADNSFQFQGGIRMLQNAVV